MQGLLNEWRRTNYTKNVTPDLTGQDVIVMGWVHEIRESSLLLLEIEKVKYKLPHQVKKWMQKYLKISENLEKNLL